MEIRQLGQSYFSVILENYHTFTDAEYVRRRIDAGVMHGAFREGELLGFIGMHDEGSVGMLEVLPPHRRQGAAAAPDGLYDQLVPGPWLGALFPDLRRK